MLERQRPFRVRRSWNSFGSSMSKERTKTELELKLERLLSISLLSITPWREFFDSFQPRYHLFEMTRHQLSVPKGKRNHKRRLPPFRLATKFGRATKLLARPTAKRDCSKFRTVVSAKYFRRAYIFCLFKIKGFKFEMSVPDYSVVSESTRQLCKSRRHPINFSFRNFCITPRRRTTRPRNGFRSSPINEATRACLTDICPRDYPEMVLRVALVAAHATA